MAAGAWSCYLFEVPARPHIGVETILETAEDLFRERGYQAVTLADVARAVGIRKPSLYYHFPKGKEELFVAVQTRMFRRIGSELREVLVNASGSLEQRLNRAAGWFFDHPPMFMLSMIHHDMPAISDEHRQALTEESYGAIMAPLIDAVQEATAAGEIRTIDPHIVAGGFLSVLEGNTIASRAGFGYDVRAMMAASLDMIVNGLRIEPDSADR